MQKLFAFFCVVLALAATTTARSDYAIDLWPTDPLAGRVEVANLMWGGASAHTIELSFMKTSVSNTGNSNCLFSFYGAYGPDHDALELSAKILTNGKIAVTLAGQTITSTGAATANTWYGLSIVINNVDLTLQMFLVPVHNPAQGTSILAPTHINQQLAFGARYGFVGYCELPVATKFMGKVDDLRFWDVERTLTMIQSTVGAVEIVEGMDAGLVVQYPFNEGEGWEWNYAISGPAFGQNSFSPAKKVGGAWGSKVTGKVDDCYIWGDPHRILAGKSMADPGWNSVKRSYSLYQKCVDDLTENTYWEVRMYHYACDSPDAATRKRCEETTVASTVYAVTIYAYGKLYYFDRAVSEIYTYECDYTTGDVVMTPVSHTKPYTEDGVYWRVDNNFNYYFYAPMGGYITASRGSWGWGYYLNIHIYTFPDCPVAYREGNCQGSGWQTYTTSRDWFLQCDHSHDSSESLLSLSSFEYESSSSPQPPCVWEEKNPTYKAWVFAHCAGVTTVAGERDEVAYEHCLLDYCYTDKIDFCANKDDDFCHIREYLAATQGLTTQYCNHDCPNNCNAPNGQCVDDVCQCNPGWAGADCCRRTEFGCFNWVNEGVKLHPYMLNTDGNFAGAHNSYVDFADYMEFLPHVDDTLLVLLTSYLDPAGETHNAIFLTADRKSKQEAPVSFTLTARGTGGAYDAYVQDTTYLTFDRATSTFRFTLDGSYYAGAQQPPSAVIYDPPAGDYTFSVTWPNPALSQILIGTGSVIDQDWEMYKVGDEQDGSFTLHVDVCDDPCDSYTECDECSADPKCGWCRDSNTCMAGDATGPLANVQCLDWRFTFGEASRVVSTSFGWPVSPFTDVVVMDDGDDLPLDISVDVTSSFSATWDAILVWPADVQTNQEDRRVLFTGASRILDALSQYTNPFIGIWYYEPGTDKFAQSVALTRSMAMTTSWLSKAIQGVPLSSAPAGADVAVDVTDILLAVASPDINFWRDVSKRMVLVSVDRPHVTLDAARIQEVKAALTLANVIPVFAATAALYDQYYELASDLGFGLVVELSANSENYPTALQHAFSRAIGQVVLLLPDENVGPVDDSTLFMFGLDSTMKAHFVVPITAAPVTLTAPGFGTATVESITTEQPWTTGQLTWVTEDNHYDVWNFDGQLVRLTGAGYDDAAVYPIVMNDASNDEQMPLRGSLYQFTGNGRGAQITAPNTPVLDNAGRVIYVPPPNAFTEEIEDGPYDIIYYEVNDMCVSSLVGEVPIYVHAVNDPPTVTGSGPEGFEDEPLVIQFLSFDLEQNPCKFTITSVVESDSDRLVGQLYQYLATAPGHMGASITSFPAEVTDFAGRVVYVGAQDCNYEGVPPELTVAPSLTFYGTETCCCGDCAGLDDADTYKPNDHVLSSAEVTFDIVLHQVNDEPHVWTEPVGRRMRQAEAELTCYSSETCVFDEDFNHPRGIQYNPAIIFAGGRDVEHDALSVYFVSSDCPEGTVAYDIQMTDPLVISASAPRLIPGFKDGMLGQALFFRPLAEEHSKLDENGDMLPYCTLQYKVNDGQLNSPDTYTIELRVRSINDLPTMTEKEVIAFEDLTKDFEITIDDADSTAVLASIQSCEGVGTLWAMNNAKQYVQVDCAHLAENPVELSITGDPKTESTHGTWQMRYLGPPDVSGDNLMTISIKLDDPEPLPVVVDVSDWWFVTVSVIPINEPPLIKTREHTAFGQKYSYSISDVRAGSLVTFGFDAMDKDSGAGMVEWTMTRPLTAEGTLSMSPDKKYVDAGLLVVISKTAEKLQAQAPMDVMKELIRTITFTTSSNPTDDAIKLSVVLTDNGHTGICPPAADGSYSMTACPLKAEITIYIDTYATAKKTNAIAIAGGVAGAGAIVGAAAAAGLYAIFKKLPAKTGEYHPWNMDGETESVSNPFYQGMDNAGENPLYNG